MNYTGSRERRFATEVGNSHRSSVGPLYIGTNLKNYPNNETMKHNLLDNFIVGLKIHHNEEDNAARLGGISTVRSNNNYVCNISNNFRAYYANLLKMYTPRIPSAAHDGILHQACLGFVEEKGTGEKDLALESYRIEQKEFYTNATINIELSHTQQKS
ncbi:hypothetical protein PoB_005342900 [Plakobranchus ocellatus]|uniref:Uncharacterized protein n=1 Tax=Plakobranchus ocellatus TaxID=259542 RepID=A0AAV4C898_9GAST|nr:hypothetical protein PoB_005342900 [Plakobranchus ocellatus]